jgi:hypothetical protein
MLVGRSSMFSDVSLAVYYHLRTSVGIHDDLHVKALAFDNGQDQIVWVACNLVEVPRTGVEDPPQRIQKSFGITPDHVLIAVTHFHTGPQVVAMYIRR